MAPRDKYYSEWVNGLPSLEGKTVAITGTTSGTGYWTAVAAVRKNADVLILLNRSSSRSNDSKALLEEEKVKAGSKTDLKQVDCDLMSFDSVRAAAEEVNNIAAACGGLNVLANNAGIMMFPDDRTKDGYDKQVQTNHLSHFLLTKLVMPSFQLAVDNGKEARISQHSSAARNMTGMMLDEKYFKACEPETLGGDALKQCTQRYHQTKLANMCFAMKLHKELKSNGYDVTKIKSVVAEPGLSGTMLGDNLLAAHKAKAPLGLGMRVGGFALNFLSDYLAQSAGDGALPLIQASFGNDVDSGDFFFPKNRRHGPPFKGISKCEPNEKNVESEKLTFSEENQNMLWKASEECIGGPFFEAKI